MMSIFPNKDYKLIINNWIKDRFTIFYSCASVLTIVVTFAEYPQVEANLQYLYLFFRFFILLAILITMNVALFFPKMEKNAHTAAYLIFCIHPAIGQFFRPGYEMALMPVFLLAFANSYIPNRIAYLIVIFSSFLFMASYSINYERNLKLTTEMYLWDNLLSQIQIPIFVYLYAKVLNFERVKNQKFELKHKLMGSQSTAIIHDLKNIFSISRLTINQIYKEAEQTKNQNLISSVNEIEKTFSTASNIILRFNQISSLSKNQMKKISIRPLIEEIIYLLNRRVKKVNIVINGDLSIYADEGLITSVLLNLFTNSIEATNLKTNPHINIFLKDKYLKFSDNGTGFDKQIIQAFNMGMAISTRDKGSGIGLINLREACDEMNAKIHIFNDSNGACVEILF